MALQIHQVCRPVPTSSSSSSVASPPSCFTKQSTFMGDVNRFSSMMTFNNNKNAVTRKGLGLVKVRSSLETTGPNVVVGQVTEVNLDTFWPLVHAAGDKIVILDMYTQWCGPCKVIAPRYKELAEKHLDMVFLKLDCNAENRALAKELGLKVLPTFKILKDSKVVKEVTGAKLEKLVGAIEEVRSS